MTQCEAWSRDAISLDCTSGDNTTTYTRVISCGNSTVEGSHALSSANFYSNLDSNLALSPTRVINLTSSSTNFYRSGNNRLPSFETSEVT